MTHHRYVSCVVLAIVLRVASLFAQTQSELNEKACGTFRKADIAMEQTYLKVLKDYSPDLQFIARMKSAQKAWLAFRDAELEALFPKSDKQAEYGTAYPMCHCVQLQHLTEERTKQLQQWLDGVPEGDVCSGSIRVSQQFAPHPDAAAKSERPVTSPCHAP